MPCLQPLDFQGAEQILGVSTFRPFKSVIKTVPSRRERLMAFADPQTVTINAIDLTLPRTSTAEFRSSYTTNDGAVKLSVSHQFGKRRRRTIRIDHSKIAADPLLATNAEFSCSVYVVVDSPNSGYTAAEVKQVVDGLTDYLTDSSGARVTQLLGSES